MPDTTNEPEEKPLTPEMERLRRRMVRTLAVSVGVMLIGLIAVLGAIVYKVSRSDAPAVSATGGAVPSAAPVEATASLPDGFSVEHVGLDGNRILFFGKTSDGAAHALVFDIEAGRIVADVAIGR